MLLLLKLSQSFNQNVCFYMFILNPSDLMYVETTLLCADRLKLKLKHTSIRNRLPDETCRNSKNSKSGDWMIYIVQKRRWSDLKLLDTPSGI